MWAEGVGAHLVVIDDAREQAWLTRVFGTRMQLWIGLSDEDADGSWEWVTGGPVTYENWGYDQPDERIRGENYAAMNWALEGGGQWKAWAGGPRGGSIVGEAIIERP